MGVDDGSEDPFSSEAGFESEGNVQTSPTEKSTLRQSTLRQSTMRSNTKGSLANRSFASEKRSYVSEASLSQSSPSLKRSATSGGFGGPKDTLFFGKEVGTLRIQDMILDRAYTFLDYVRGGLELRMMLGIDFTRSNMDKQNPDSLHSLVDMDLPTSYETAIIALGSVLRSYDTTDEYAVYGFGARIPPSHSAGMPSQDEISGL
ncbi:Cpne7 [Symbiodinium sp. CCMP2592]|nr:Cpne7 [Symbiodinium sp. CCMP2592]